MTTSATRIEDNKLASDHRDCTSAAFASKIVCSVRVFARQVTRHIQEPNHPKMVPFETIERLSATYGAEFVHCTLAQRLRIDLSWTGIRWRALLPTVPPVNLFCSQTYKHRIPMETEKVISFSPEMVDVFCVMISIIRAKSEKQSKRKAYARMQCALRKTQAAKIYRLVLTFVCRLQNTATNMGKQLINFQICFCRWNSRSLPSLRSIAAMRDESSRQMRFQ